MKKNIIFYIKLLLVFVILYVLLFNPFDTSDLGGYKIDSHSSMEYFISLSKEGDTIFTNEDGVVYSVKKIKTITYYDSIFYGFASKGGRILEPFIIPNEVVFDSNFILLVQLPLRTFGTKYTYPESLYKDTTVVNGKKIPIWFFVINKIKDIEYGPYTLAQYLEKRVEIGVPEDLKLRLENPSVLYNFKYKNLKGAK